MNINKGYCEYFRDIVVSKLEKIFPSETFLCVCVRDFQGYDTIWDNDYIKRQGIIPPEIFNELPDIPYHAWFIHDNMHYDAETPEGVSNFFEMPFFKWYSSLKDTERNEVIKESIQRYNVWN